MKMPMRASLLIVLVLTLLLSACGFHLRGHAAFALPFKTLYIKAANANAPFITELKRAIEVNGARVTDTPEQAQLTLQIVSESTGPADSFLEQHRPSDRIPFVLPYFVPGV